MTEVKNTQAYFSNKTKIIWLSYNFLVDFSKKKTIKN